MKVNTLNLSAVDPPPHEIKSYLFMSKELCLNGKMSTRTASVASRNDVVQAPAPRGRRTSGQILVQDSPVDEDENWVHQMILSMGEASFGM